MPLDQKRSILVPVIKRAGLDPTDTGTFRPIANVSFIPKVIEKIIAYQLLPYLEANNLIPAIQSGHSTETLLLRLLIRAIGHIFRCDWCIPLLAGIIPWGAHSLCSPWAN